MDIVTGGAIPEGLNKWRELVYQWVKHCVERCGKKEVESWYWEVWNEPNGYYWKGRWMNILSCMTMLLTA